MPTFDIESILDDARDTALAEGLTRIVGMHLKVGQTAGISGEKACSQLTTRLRGSLFESCKVTWEPSQSSSVTLSSIEGYEFA